MLQKIKDNLLLVALIWILVFIVYPFIKEHRELKDKQQTAPVLKESEKEKIIIEKGRVTHVTKDKIKINPNARNTVVTVKDDNTIEVYSPKWGFINEFGLASFYSANKICVGVDNQFFYWRTWGVNAGVGMSVDGTNRVRGFLAGMKQIPLKQFDNTSMFVGIDTDMHITGGIRVEF